MKNISLAQGLFMAEAEGLLKTEQEKETQTFLDYIVKETRKIPVVETYERILNLKDVLESEGLLCTDLSEEQFKYLCEEVIR